MFNGLFRKKKSFDDAAKAQFVDAVAGMLELQKALAGSSAMNREDGNPKPKAIGYVYGFVDAALRTIGQDMADSSVGVPVTFQILRRLWPEDAYDYMDFLVDSIGQNDLVMFGVMHGGQQFLDYAKPGREGAPMGLARFMIDGD